MAKIVLPKITSLNQLRSGAPGMEYWLIACANNLGGNVTNADDAFRILQMNAQETTTEDFDGEDGVIKECNGIRAIVQKELNKKAPKDSRLFNDTTAAEYAEEQHE